MKNSIEEWINRSAIIQKIKKNRQLSVSEKRELIAFWQTYECPITKDAKLQADYYDGEVKQYTVEEKLNQFYDETPDFIRSFFYCMSEGKEFRTRFATYKTLDVS